MIWVRQSKDSASQRYYKKHIFVISNLRFDNVSYPSSTAWRTPRVRFLCPFPSKIPNRWYSDMPPVSEIIGTGCSCYYAHGVWNLVCTVCVCSHLPSPPQEEKRHKVKMPCASMLKCQCLTSVVDVWNGEFDITKICFLNASASQNLYIELTLFWDNWI